jgi:protein phosphatase
MDCRLWIVADGMGGHSAGEVASALTIQGIAMSIDSPWPDTAIQDVPAAGDRLIHAFDAAQRSVCLHGLNDEACQGMGSTAIAALIEGTTLHMCHVGDVRGYHVSGGKLTRVTNDHSLVWELVLSGLLTADEARSHPQRGRVTQAIGGLQGINPVLSTLQLQTKDRVLLCSDGLWEPLGDHAIGEIVSAEGSMLELASELVDRANHCGGPDNITAVLYEHTNEKPSEE